MELHLPYVRMLIEKNTVEIYNALALFEIRSRLKRLIYLIAYA